MRQSLVKPKPCNSTRRVQYAGLLLFCNRLEPLGIIYGAFDEALKASRASQLHNNINRLIKAAENMETGLDIRRIEQ